MGRQTTLKVTAKGQVTPKRDVLAHLSVQAGDRITVDLCPRGGVVMKAASQGTIEPFFASLRDKGRSVPVEDMNKVIADGWAGKIR
jgi:hypothetical protein